VPIPGNDDAIRAIRLFTSRIADNVLEGLNLADERFVSPAASDEGAAARPKPDAGGDATAAPAAAVEETDDDASAMIDDLADDDEEMPSVKA